MIERKEWIAMLARVSSPVDPVKATQALLHYLPLLTDLPNEAFTRASLEAVAMSPQALHIRNLREVKEPLAAWWKDNRPRAASTARLQAPPAPEATPMPAEEREAVRRQILALADELSAKEPEKPRVRSHVIPAEVLAEARARLMAKRVG